MAKKYTLSLFLFVVIFIACGSMHAQVITGMLNLTQTNVVAINPNNAEVTVLDATGFAISDQVLLIQMQGALISTANNATFGDVQNYNGAGNYEIATLCGISGNQLTFDYELINSFDASAMVQVILIPQYGNLTITGTLTAPAWNGTTGGVLVLEAVSIDLLGDIEMSNKGFRGGAFQNSGLNCNAFIIHSLFAYDNSGNGALKGEGIAAMAPAMAYGKGAAANGGGGGNDHNSGGAGGGNIGNGGNGGTNGSTGFFDCKGNHPGVGGKGQTSTDRIFLGGGGGAGHGNNGIGTSGGNGGGIVILIAQTMTGNNVFIRTNGETALNTSYNGNDPGGDAAGGGGSGGSVHLDIPSISGNITVESIGGNGGDVVHTESTNDCFGPGGGGAGGIVKFDGPAPASVTTVLTGGSNGTNEIIAGTSSCLGSPQGATTGQNGTILSNIPEVPAGTTDFAGCDIQLSIEMADFVAFPNGKQVDISWVTLSEKDNAFFILERSRDAVNFNPIHQISGAGTTSERQFYSFTDQLPINGFSYYRLKSLDFDGSPTFSTIRAVSFFNGLEIIRIYPNPVRTGEDVTVHVNSEFQVSLSIEVYNVLGELLIKKSEVFERGEHSMKLSTQELGLGAYFMRIEGNNQVKTKKILIID